MGVVGVFQLKLTPRRARRVCLSPTAFSTFAPCFQLSVAVGAPRAHVNTFLWRKGSVRCFDGPARPKSPSSTGFLVTKYRLLPRLQAHAIFFIHRARPSLALRCSVSTSCIVLITPAPFHVSIILIRGVYLSSLSCSNASWRVSADRLATLLPLVQLS